jgi:hypothetical protein
MTTKRFIALVVVVVLAAGLFVVAAPLPWDSSRDGNGAASDLERIDPRVHAETPSRCAMATGS